MGAERTFTIEALRREFGVTARALRYYEEQGLLQSARQGARRIYGPRERGRLRLILVCRRAGLSVAMTRQLLCGRAAEDGAGAPAGDGGDVQLMRHLIAILTEKRQDLELLLSMLRGEGPPGRQEGAGPAPAPAAASGRRSRPRPTTAALRA